MRDRHNNKVKVGDYVKLVGDKIIKNKLMFNTYFAGEVTKIVGHYEIDVSHLDRYNEWNEKLMQKRGSYSSGFCHLQKQNFEKVVHIKHMLNDILTHNGYMRVKKSPKQK